MRLRVKFLLQILLTVIIIFSAFAVYLNYNYIRFTTRLSYNLTNLYSTQIAKSIESSLKSDMRVIETMKELMEYHIDRNGGIDKQFLLDLLSAIEVSNPDYLAVWTSFELSFLNPDWTLNHGRVRFGAKLDKGSIKFFIDTLETEKENVEGAYYQMKVGKYRSLIMDPYFYTYSVEDTSSSYLETSLALPVFYNNRFVGLEGVDVSLKDLKRLIQVVIPFKNSYAFLVSTNGDIAAHENDSYLGKKITLVYPELKKYNVLDSISAGKKFSVNLHLGESKELYYFSFTPLVVADPQLPWSLVYVVPISQVLMNVQKRLTTSIVLSIIALLILVIIIWIFIVDVSVKIERANETLRRMSIGQINDSLKLTPHGKDEIATMYESINQLIDNLNSMVKFSLEIGRGNLDAYYELKSEEDILGKSLIEMKVNLKRAKEEEEKRSQEAEKISWLQNGITEINEILRLHSNDLDELSFEVIKFLVKYLGATQGALYTIEEKDSKKVVRLKIAYAYDRKKQLEAEFEIGEGLVGRAILEKRVVHIKELPQGYVFVTSGLGGDTPDHLIILPLIFEDEVYGAIELLSFNDFQDYQIEFLEQASYRIASTVYNIMKNIESQKLLEQFRQQSEQIQNREQELSKRMQELAEKEREIAAFRRRYESIFSAIDATYAHLEYNKDFKLIEVNEYFTTVFGIAKNSLLGKHITEILPEAKESSKWLERFIEDLSKGLVRHKQTKYTFGSKTLIFDETYIPLFDLEGELDTILCLGINIARFNVSQNQ